MATLTQAHQQWATRPADERFTSLSEMSAETGKLRAISQEHTHSSYCGNLSMAPVEGEGALATMVEGRPMAASHWAFSQMCSLVGAPASYLRTLPADIAADCFNHSVANRRTETVKSFYSRRDCDYTPTLRAVTGPNYGRIWNNDIVNALIRTFGDGPDAAFTVPGEFGNRVEVTKDNTTLFAGDRDMFVFLADESNKIEVPNRRDGETGLLSRGFFIQNSEVGSATLKVGTFLFDYVCSNRMVWGAEGYQEVSIRHSLNAPHRWIDEVMPALESLRSASMFDVRHAITEAKARRLDADDVEKVLVKRFTRNQAQAIKLAHMNDEGRPMESVWDIATGATAYARGIKHQNERVLIERTAGELLAKAA